MKGILLLSFGCVALALGFVGMFVPILPTTPFILVSATCFSACNPRLYQWLLSTRCFGEFISHYRNKNGISTRVKANALVFLWVSLCVSGILIRQMIPILILMLVGAAVTAHILTIRGR